MMLQLEIGDLGDLVDLGTLGEGGCRSAGGQPPPRGLPF